MPGHKAGSEANPFSGKATFGWLFVRIRALSCQKTTMLSYRHSFHAGNFADLLKHLSQLYILEYLNRKEKPYLYLDTHAGAGLYSLRSAQAEKTAEYQQGIQRLYEHELRHPLLRRFRQLIDGFNPPGKLLHYPGSPALAARLCRPQDRLQLHELHPADRNSLSKLFKQDLRVKVWQSDGFQALKTCLPPSERRGLVLIDPPYEVKTDYEQVIKSLQDGLKRFATGTYAIWYPLLQKQQTEAWMRDFRNAGLTGLLRIEQSPLPDTSGFGMTGSGMLIINPPYTMAEDFRNLLSELSKLLQQGGNGRYSVDILQ